MLLALTFASVILFLLLELRSDYLHMEEVLLRFGWVRLEVLVVCHGVAEARRDTV